METGSIIQGTHRPQDLVPAFATALRDIAYDGLEDLGGFVIRSVSTITGDDDDHPWWESERCAELLNSMFELLNDHAPEDYYFGAHAGDGSDFGFWPAES